MTVRTALRGGSRALAGTLVGRVANVVALLLAARALGSEEFGGFSLALSTALLVTSLSALGLPVAAQKLVAEAREVDGPRRERLIDAALGLTVFVGVLAVLVFLVAGPWVASRVLDQGGITPLLAVATLLVLSTPCVEILAGLLAALERFRDVGVYRAVQGCLGGCLLGAVLLTAPGAAAALWAVFVADVLTCVLGWKLLSSARGAGRHRWLMPRTEFVSAARSLLRVSMPALLASVSLQPALWVGQVMLSRQPDGLDQVGMFAVALRWSAVALFVPATMGSVLLPMLGRLRANGREADARTLFVRYGGMTVVFSTVICLVLVALAKVLMGLQGAGYVVATTALVVLAVAVVPTALNNVLSQRALAEGRLALWVWSDLVLAATLAVGAVTLVPLLRDVGLAWSYLLAYVATCLVLLPVAFSARKRAGAP